MERKRQVAAGVGVPAVVAGVAAGSNVLSGGNNALIDAIHPFVQGVGAQGKNALPFVKTATPFVAEGIPIVASILSGISATRARFGTVLKGQNVMDATLNLVRVAGSAIRSEGINIATASAVGLAGFTFIGAGAPVAITASVGYAIGILGINPAYNANIDFNDQARRLIGDIVSMIDFSGYPILTAQIKPIIDSMRNSKDKKELRNKVKEMEKKLVEKNIFTKKAPKTKHEVQDSIDNLSMEIATSPEDMDELKSRRKAQEGYKIHLDKINQLRDLAKRFG